MITQQPVHSLKYHKLQDGWRQHSDSAEGHHWVNRKKRVLPEKSRRGGDAGQQGSVFRWELLDLPPPLVSTFASREFFFQLVFHAPMECDFLEKGLRNELGEQNCFLNVGIQSLWHLSSFRTKFNNEQHHQHKGPCVFCALKVDLWSRRIDHAYHVSKEMSFHKSSLCPLSIFQVIFCNYEWSEDSILPPQALRDTLSALFKDQGRFQINAMVRCRIQLKFNCIENRMNRMLWGEFRTSFDISQQALINLGRCIRSVGDNSDMHS